MSGVNKVILIGHLGKDPEVRHLDGNVSVASFPLATSESYNNKEGKRIEQTEWHNIVMWRGLADVAAKYLQKGKLVYIEGKLRTRSFEDKEGHRKYSTEIVAESFKVLGRKSDFEAPTNHVAPVAENAEPETKLDEHAAFSIDENDDDLPF